jgi:hypothetical protein
MSVERIEARTFEGGMKAFRDKFIATECVLCGKLRPEIKSLYVATASFGKRIGAPEGKQRSVGYGLCYACSQLPDSTRLIEEAILAEFEGVK